MPRPKTAPIVLAPEQTAASFRARAANLRNTAGLSRLANVKRNLLQHAAEWDQKAADVLAGIHREPPKAA